ncbi:hypothetical protein [Nocardia huaxiensis]|uniref:Tetratricopeptide repeat protein n=1 Tax=Nocardia huaxiensis TaxID=2755382 RepID=A0A7D6Z0W3_9NOCA|nr:hypothetical protein [Nocardia huaxiensis]QLY29686.1 hypothetical protein H0264_31340 [Nocardia huaxiensis]UFS96739.1 hypothetical protein LPY97_02040 [Nocardia huaxiensis]
MSAPEDGNGREVAKKVAFIAALVLVLVFYFFLLGRIALSLIGKGSIPAVVLGIGILILPIVGVWVVASSVRAAFAHQHLARRAHDEGFEVDVSDLPRRPSGRLERAAADELFEKVKQEFEADPDNWRTNYRAARAYDHAGDRTRAREMMGRAVELERRERTGK